MPEMPRQPVSRALAIALFALGSLLWWLLGNDLLTGPARLAGVGAAVLLSQLPPVARWLRRIADRVRHPSPRALDWMTLAIALLATAYFIFTAFRQDRDLFPKTHDEGSYRLGMQMLSEGKLWMPQHELADFFDTFYVIVRPVYASLYFPGTALMYAPSLWLGWPTWALPVIFAGAIVALLYRIVTEWIDGAAGLLAALLMASLSWFRMLSVLIYSHVPMLLLGLLLIFAWMRWRRSRHWGWAALAGVCVGWSAITRPVDALCYAAPVGIAFLIYGRNLPWRDRFRSLAIVVWCSLPFLTLQVIFNLKVTGHLLQTPYSYYLQRQQPDTGFGFAGNDPLKQSESVVPQKRAYYDQFMRPYIARHRPAELARTWRRIYGPMVIDSTLPARGLLPLALVGVLALRDRRLRVLLAVLPIFILLYALNPFFLEHYAVVVAPAMVVLVISGAQTLSAAWPRQRHRAAAALGTAISAFALTGFSELNSRVNDETFSSPMLRTLHTQLPELVSKPAVVLFKWTPGDPIYEEPVYNSEVAWPDDAPIIRAHDLGPRNIEIFRYYAKHQPARTFYQFDRKTKSLHRLGSAASLAGGA